MNIATAFYAFISLSTTVSGCFAAALAPSKTTDDSVCDLSPGTTEELSYRAFISADVPMDQKAMGYRRLAGNFVAQRCSQGQMLVLNSKYSSELDAHYLNNLAGDLCPVSDVVRTEVNSIEPFTNKQVAGYELRCRISKFDAFRKQLQMDEAKESTESLLARLRAKPPTRTSASTQGAPQDTQPQTPKQDCSKLTLSATLFGGGGCR